MHYESPQLEDPFELYNTPHLLDVQKVSGAGVCITGGGCSSTLLSCITPFFGLSELPRRS